MKSDTDPDPQPGHAAFAQAVVVSEPGAAIRVECIELTGALKRSLTTSLTHLPAPDLRRYARREKS